MCQSSVENKTKVLIFHHRRCCLVWRNGYHQPLFQRPTLLNISAKPLYVSNILCNIFILPACYSSIVCSILFKNNNKNICFSVIIYDMGSSDINTFLSALSSNKYYDLLLFDREQQHMIHTPVSTFWFWSLEHV